MPDPHKLRDHECLLLETTEIWGDSLQSHRRRPEAWQPQALALLSSYAPLRAPFPPADSYITAWSSAPERPPARSQTLPHTFYLMPDKSF